MGFKIWDKVSPIYTPHGDDSKKSKWTAAEWLAQYAWAEISPAIVSDGPINGLVFLEYYNEMSMAQKRGFSPTNIENYDLTLAEWAAWQQDCARAAAEAAVLQQEHEQALFEAQMAACEAQQLQAAMVEYQTLLML